MGEIGRKTASVMIQEMDDEGDRQAFMAFFSTQFAAYIQKTHVFAAFLSPGEAKKYENQNNYHIYDAQNGKKVVFREKTQ